jgi:hypothetical protein
MHFQISIHPHSFKIIVEYVNIEFTLPQVPIVNQRWKKANDAYVRQYVNEKANTCGFTGDVDDPAKYTKVMYTAKNIYQDITSIEET